MNESRPRCYRAQMFQPSVDRTSSRQDVVHPNPKPETIRARIMGDWFMVGTILICDRCENPPVVVTPDCFIDRRLEGSID